MNIVIVSKDSFFVSGTISLINEVWLPTMDINPVFLVTEENKTLLTPDIIITDVYRRSSVPAHPPSSDQTSTGKNKPTERYVSIFIAARCHVGDGSCHQRLLKIKKGESVQLVRQIFGRRNVSSYGMKNLLSAYNSKPQDDIILSRQQAMVVKYTRMGLSLTDISRVTCLSVKTISSHKRAVMRKLGMKNNNDFYRYALMGFD